MTHKITMNIIAEKCSTSIGTVDRALNNRPGINQKTRDQILRAAKELGYKPNRIAGALSRKKVIRLGVVYSFEPVDFYSHIEAGVERAKKELADYSVQVESIRSPVLSPIQQKELLNSIDLSKYDGFAINSGGTSIAEIINRFIAQGIPVITFNTDAPESNRLFYVGNNSRQSGRVGGELMGKMLSGTGKVTILGNFLGTTTFIERFGGFCEVIQEQYPHISLCTCAECYSDPLKAFQVVTEMLQQAPDINGIFSTGYAGTIGAAEAVKQLNRPDVKVIGYDLGKQTIESLNDGWCTAVLYQDPFQQGYQAVHLLARHLLDNWLPSQKQLHIETKIVMKYNMENSSNNELLEGRFY
ncbi:LacI family DNA-binding transcriptional regulator [Oscillospiraceae bacterium PP1C4]